MRAAIADESPLQLPVSLLLLSFFSLDFHRVEHTTRTRRCAEPSRRFREPSERAPELNGNRRLPHSEKEKKRTVPREENILSLQHGAHRGVASAHVLGMLSFVGSRCPCMRASTATGISFAGAPLQREQGRQGRIIINRVPVGIGRFDDAAAARVPAPLSAHRLPVTVSGQTIPCTGFTKNERRERQGGNCDTNPIGERNRLCRITRTADSGRCLSGSTQPRTIRGGLRR